MTMEVCEAFVIAIISLNRTSDSLDKLSFSFISRWNPLIVPCDSAGIVHVTFMEVGL